MSTRRLLQTIQLRNYSRCGFGQWLMIVDQKRSATINICGCLALTDLNANPSGEIASSLVTDIFIFHQNASQVKWPDQFVDVIERWDAMLCEPLIKTHVCIKSRILISTAMEFHIPTVNFHFFDSSVRCIAKNMVWLDSTEDKDENCALLAVQKGSCCPWCL